MHLASSSRWTLCTALANLVIVPAVADQFGRCHAQSLSESVEKRRLYRAFGKSVAFDLQP